MEQGGDNRHQDRNPAFSGVMIKCKQKVLLCKRREDIPVSYTHLRAHETCADLVCRLLLEKKKRIGFSGSD